MKLIRRIHKHNNIQFQKPDLDKDCTDLPSTSTAAQKALLLDHLIKKGAINTLEIRELLGIPHPAGIIKRLRDEDHKIGKRIVRVESVLGVHTKIAEYFYVW